MDFRYTAMFTLLSVMLDVQYMLHLGPINRLTKYHKVKVDFWLVSAVECRSHVAGIMLKSLLLRILQNQPRQYHVTDLYVNYNTLSVTDLYIQRILLLVHNFVYHKDKLPEILIIISCLIMRYILIIHVLHPIFIYLELILVMARDQSAM